MGNGKYSYMCNECHTERTKKYRETANGKAKIYAAVKKSTKKFQYKQNSRMKLNHKIASGRILKPAKCSACLELKMVEGHHIDYSKPLDVMWLCKKCHRTLFHKHD